ncbi:MAG: phosphatase PAP2 family protein [Patescibacteria group bacterium]|nr:phosphatase PAP2 family protein [Patescibacteria group bacterium]
MKISKRINFFLAGSFILALFVIFSVLVKKKFLNGFDFDTTVRLQDHISRHFDTLFSWFSLFGSFEVTSVVVIAIFILFLFKRKVFWSLGLFFAAILVEVLGKVYLPHPSPPFFMLRYDLGFNFPSSYVSTGFSYPSGHMTRTSYLLVVLLFFLFSSKLGKYQKYFWGAGLFVFGGIMFISRIYLGEHWFSDVFGGLLLGLSSSLISLAFW